MIVSVENIFLETRVAGDMNLRDTFRGNRVNVNRWIEAMILRRNVNIVDVQEYAAIGTLDNFVQELPLRHLRLVEFRIAADVVKNGENKLLLKKP